MAFNDGRVVSNFITQALRGQDLTIYGEGKQTRSFCYVDDLVEGLFRVGMREDFGGPMNLGNPREFSMLELAELTLELTGRKKDIVFQPMPIDDPKQRQPNIGLAQRLIGFEPKVHLREGLERTIAEFRQRLTALGELADTSP